MANFAVIISLLSILGFAVGMFLPMWTLSWYAGDKNRVNSFIIYSFLLFLSFLLFAVTSEIGESVR